MNIKHLLVSGVQLVVHNVDELIEIDVLMSKQVCRLQRKSDGPRANQQSAANTTSREWPGWSARIVDDAGSHEGAAEKAGRKNLDLYVKYTGKDVTVAGVLDYICKDGNFGLAGITNRGTFKSITIFTQDGAVRVQQGKIYSCDNNGRCTPQ